MYGGDLRSRLETLIPNWFGDPFNIFETVISLTIAVMTVVAGIWFLYLLISGGITLISSSGDKQAIEEATKRVTTGFIGLVVVVGGLFIASLIGTIFGINILSPGETLRNIHP